MTTGGAQLRVCEIAVGAFGKAAMAERAERGLISKTCGRDDLLDDTS